MPYHTDLYLPRIPYEPELTFPPQPAEKYPVGPGWMSFRPYSGGELLNWGCHGLSMVQWALQMDNSGPVEVWVDPAEKLETVVYDTPETRDRGDAAYSKSVINYKYANGVVLTLSSIDPKVGGGATFIGDKGRITIFRGGYECDPKGLDQEPLPAGAIRVTKSDNHMQNFYDCVSSGPCGSPTSSTAKWPHPGWPGRCWETPRRRGNIRLFRSRLISADPAGSPRNSREPPGL